MNCPKDFAIALSFLLIVVGITTGILANQIQTVDAKLDSRNQLIYSIPHLESDISEIKQDLKEIKEILRGDYSK